MTLLTNFFFHLIHLRKKISLPVVRKNPLLSVSWSACPSLSPCRRPSSSGCHSEQAWALKEQESITSQSSVTSHRHLSRAVTFFPTVICSRVSTIERRVPQLSESNVRSGLRRVTSRRTHTPITHTHTQCGSDVA